MREMGRRSMQLALERTAQPGRIEVMPVEVVVRESVARST
jgi:DNA-binding LacI/PurR family transcriptional regulator